MKNLENGKKQKINIKAVAGLITFIIMIVLIFKTCDDKPTNEQKKEPQKSFSKIEAYSYSQQFVEDNLKAPSTAKFTYNPDIITQINDTIFNVRAFVDSENSFGAKIRTNYSCKIIFLPHTDNVICENLIFE